MGLGLGLGIRASAREVMLSTLKALRHAREPKETRLEALLLCHALEKGMGMPSPRKGFGKEKCRKLVSVLKRMAVTNELNSWEYAESKAVLDAYLDFQEADGIDVSALRASATALPDGTSMCRGGFRLVHRDELEAGMAVDVPLLFKSKHSMRAYSDEPLSEGVLLEAIDLARRCPSACNRQPWRVYYSVNPVINSAVRDALPAQAFLNGVPSFLVVTCNRKLFNKSEVYQWYVNGGIFLSYLTLALHHLGIGSIILEYNLGSKSEINLRRTLGMDLKDEIVAIVGCGYYPNKAKWICADRRPVSDIAMRIN